MKLKELKSSIVVAMAAPYIKEHGTEDKDPRYPRLSVWVDKLHMQLGSSSLDHRYHRLDIWDYSIGGKKVFSADIAPLDIIRCDAGNWFDLFMTSFALQASMSIEKYLELREHLEGFSPANEEGGLFSRPSALSVPRHSLPH